MTQSEPSLGLDLSWRMRASEAMLLADLLRTSRWTVLYAEEGVGRTELLTQGVLPLLTRRASDDLGVAGRESRIVVPFANRRGDPASTRIAERVIRFDAWGPAPLAALQGAILETLPVEALLESRALRLADLLDELSLRLDLQFLIVLDRFEHFWDGLGGAEGGQAENDFFDELSETVNREGLRVNVLLSISEEAQPRLRPLRERIAGFDDSALRLLRWHPPANGVPVLDEIAEPPPPRPTPPPAEASERPASMSFDAFPRESTAAPDAAPRPRTSRPDPIKTEGVYAFIESTLSQTADLSVPWHEDEDTDPASARPAPEADHAPPPATADGPQREAAAPGSEWWLTESQRRTAPGKPPPFVEPPHPIDQWLDSALGWLSRRLGAK